jgi:GNAT superfamily N-acetyltransferase
MTAPGNSSPTPSARHRGVPPEVAELEIVMAQGWPAPEQEPLGQWLLRAAEGFTSRGNSALCLGDPGLPRELAVTTTTTWYAARALPAVFALPTDVDGQPYDGDLVELVTRSGADAAHPTLAMTAAVRDLPTGAYRPVRPDGQVSWSSGPDPQWLAAFGRYRSVPARHTAVARAILTGSPGQRFYAVTDPARPRSADPAVLAVLACARVSVHDGWAGVHAMWVDPAHRRGGWATAIVAALADDVRSGALPGVTAVYLQVERANTGAVAAYRGMGFTPHHGHVYLHPASAPGHC